MNFVASFHFSDNSSPKFERRDSLKQKYFDCHFHIIDKNFPVVPNQGFMPDAFTSEDYLDRLKAVDLCGGAVVSGSFRHSISLICSML